MVTHHTASLITANACGGSRARSVASWLVVSAIAVNDQLSALPGASSLLVCS